VQSLLRMQEDRVLTYGDGNLSLTPEGLPLARVVAALSDVYLRDSTARHSVAI
jgi:oxygen-independent coproporphyrinogen III oxidase